MENALANASFAKTENNFSLSKQIVENTEYQILTSNSKVKNYEKLDIWILVVSKINFRPSMSTTLPIV